ncbi:MAG: Diguanylate cyclase/phosphodiesterase [Xanthobacteraceae bacterium]|nr:Diguanylate cyclase/phosphodiesterase [Xanthobacteraceae bacterium]
MPMHKLLARQIEAAQSAGVVDVSELVRLVSVTYEQQESDRQRSDRSMALMIEELDQLNRRLETLVEDRTTALREREGELRDQNLRFDAALNNMSQGLLMFDHAGRVVISNRRYLEMYALTSEQVRPGRTVQDLLEMRAQNGTFFSNTEKYVETLLATIERGDTFFRLVDLPDGRTIAVCSRPMAGGGWVVTHEDITERRRAEKQIAHMAHHDPLTDLPNRVLLRDRMAQALSGIARGERLAVLYLDLDHFKGVNDSLGHQLGDELLQAVADRLRDCVRPSDTVARIGGDEFAIIQTGVAQINDTAELARTVGEAVRAPYELSGHVVACDSSIGVAMAPDDGIEPEDLLKNADMALYRAKSDGRGTYRFFEPEMDARMKARRALEVDLRDALAGEQFDLLYQPIVGLADGRITCCEALIRWHHPERGMIPPVEFIPIAEEIGLIIPIGEWVIRKACADAARWPNDVKVAVNLSALQVMNQNLVPVLISALATAGLPAQRLEIEITETVLMQNADNTLMALHQLRELGVSISMDDFGTGYSSLSYLHSFPFDKIKIDRCFISGLPQAEDSLAIVRAVTGLAKNLNMKTTAEGVETQEQLDALRALDCTEMQGFLFSRPRRPEEVIKLMRDDSGKKAANG